ncbi:MAG: hypothetical protein MT490_16630 [Sphingomonas sp.]|uniref:hypothetical protein n=1 Tax=Sphingomonas sp. TaxID=28214 RepID=UPI0022726D12|nr:hypothetical protein [Sphingomonas sp.]MCX8477416.1 hypothetical protein [Sphingomonas sp.]
MTTRPARDSQAPMDADIVEQNLAIWKESLFSSIPVGGLLARNPVAHKWKATFRSMMLREAVCWRAQDLLAQSFALHEQGYGLGTRILIRSAFETLATLVYLNQLMQQVLDGRLNFHLFGDKTTKLLLGSRNGDREGPRSINILTVLEKCDKRYPGMMEVYADLSESAHPSYAGLCMGYSKVNYDEYETTFSNRWMELYSDRNLAAIDMCMMTFHHEYNEVWIPLFEALEKWIETNDAQLEATKDEFPQDQ